MLFQNLKAIGEELSEICVLFCKYIYIFILSHIGFSWTKGALKFSSWQNSLCSDNLYLCSSALPILLQSPLICFLFLVAIFCFINPGYRLIGVAYLPPPINPDYLGFTVQSCSCCPNNKGIFCQRSTEQRNKNYTEIKCSVRKVILAFIFFFLFFCMYNIDWKSCSSIVKFCTQTPLEFRSSLVYTPGN
jgi:hypothetical protein